MPHGALTLLAAVLVAAAPQGKAGAAGPDRCRPAATIADLPTQPVPEWYALYLAGRKVGWLQSRSAAETRDGKEVRVHRQEMLVEVVVGPRKVQRRAREERVYEARVGGRLLSMATTFGGDGGDRSVQVTCGARTCAARIAATDGTRNAEIPHPGEAVEQAEASRLAALRCAAVSGPQLQADDLRVKQMVDRFAGRSTLGGAGVQVPVSVVEQSEAGDRVAARVLVGDDGRILETRMGDGMVIRLEPEATARRLDTVDLFTMLRLPLPGPLPREVPMTIVYALRGVPEGFDLADERQSVAPGPGGETVLTVKARAPVGPDVPRGKPAEKGDPDQAATIDVDWDHPAIRKLAASTVGSTQGTWAAARKIGAEVNRRLDKVYGQSRDRASEILAQGKGDCTEHTRLFVALARAAGIRAREVKGLVYTSYDQGGPGLYWHAWPEVKVGNAWVALDPTFGQDVADATHVALGRGTRQDAVALIGSMQLLRAEPRPP